MEENRQKIAFSYNNKLPVKINTGTVSYKVLVALFNNEKVDTINYEVSMRWIEKDNISYIAIVDRAKKIFINNAEPDLITEELTAKVSSALYPLALLIDSTGKCIGIYNFPEIKKRWEAKKQQISAYYTGDWLEKFLRLNDKAFLDKHTLFRRLQNDWFICAYFQPLYRAYTQQLKIQNTLAVPLFPGSERIEYLVNQQIDQYPDEAGLIRIEMNGNLSSTQYPFDPKNEPDAPGPENLPEATGCCRGEYYLEPQYNTIRALMLDCTLDTYKKKKISIIVTSRPDKKLHKTQQIPEKKSVMQKIRQILE